ncbi:cadherin-related family member 5 isoform X1 [Thunnus maccoyii]|uniref:cadherin-related family member 5 isoform X1 n=1 Tax=Thunnus maccoyii TaxID=8240 RepID=UPI001C4B633D|nr:cadherin-related family member 5 isoform X1 [Thunnus maccoyii]XP_042267953.1 cadherin-related family member 5 isoform X1 [Thunnus maccoyii]XP_042267954.1 cadherin-related family member 5 isoform X1 [Thunnus maccoyii]
MALTDLKWSLSQPKTLICTLMVFLSLHTVTGMSGWDGCLDGQDVFATVRENSLSGEVVAELMADTTIEGVHWSLDGKDADWFLLDGRNIRLNTSAEKILDREAQGPVLMAELSCYEEDTLQSVYRIMVEILNENDNSPVFAEDTVQSLIISELTPVNTLVFTVHATDADNDKIIYSIDQTSPDAEYFKVDLPNSGEVILSKPLDYETKILLTVTIHASEMSTAERFNTSTTITITVLDGDDQYPQFLPCTLLFQDEANRICTSPVYTVNVTEGEEDIVLDFSPGPIHAVDGDRGLSSSLSYAILSGDDDGRFLMDTVTGEVRMTQAVRDRLTTPALHLQIMAYQDDDPRKYSLATVLVRVMAVNQFYPQFDRAEYNGFVTADKSPASLVNTYGSKALMLHVQDQDFNNGFNPMIYFTFSPKSNHTDIYQVTQEGLLIARTNELKPKQKHFLEIMAIDQESGDATFATVVVEVLSEGQSIPLSPLGDDRVISCTVGKAMFLSMVFMSVLGCILCLVMWLKKKHKGQRSPLERGCVAQGKHPNVSLRWFQLVSHRSAMPQMEEIPFSNEEYGTCNPSFSFTDKPGIYTPKQDLPLCPGPVPPKTNAAPDISFIPTETVRSPVIFNNNVPTPTKIRCRPPTFHPPAVEVIQTVGAPPPQDNPSSPTPPPDTTPDPTEALPDISPSTSPPPSCPDSQANTSDDPTEPVTNPSSQPSPSSVPCSHPQIASAETDKPFSKPRVNTPPNRPHSPSESSPLPEQTSTPPPSPEHAPLKAKLVHIDTSPVETPPVTPGGTSVTLSVEADQPSTSLDLPDQPEQPDDAAEASSQDRRLSTISGNTQDSQGVVHEEDDGFLGDEDADKNSEGEELDPDEEELLRVMARCNPIFITFNK